MAKKTNHVVGYIRVSTAEQASNGDSLDTQRQQLAGFALMKGWRLDRVFVEAGVSGSVPLADRPEGSRLLAALGPGDIVVAAKLDRCFRSASDALSTLEALKEQGVGLYLLDLGSDSVTGNGISRLVFTILAAVAEAERDRLKERIRDVKRHLASQGVYGGGKRPFGHDVVGQRLVPNPAEQATIATMVRMRRDGASFRAIGEAAGMAAMSAKRIVDRAEAQAGSEHQRAVRVRSLADNENVAEQP